MSEPARSDPIKAISLFYEEIKNCRYSDYGDFMRKATLYLNNLIASLQGNAAAIVKLREMKTYTQYAPNWHTESTRARLLRDTQSLKELTLRFEASPGAQTGPMPD